MTIYSLPVNQPPPISVAAPALTPITDVSSSAIIYGALQAYEFYLAEGLTEEANLTKQYLLNLKINYSFSDGYAQKTLGDFSVLTTDFKTWWDARKAALVSSDPTQPAISLSTWIPNNSLKFNPNALPGDKLLNNGEYTHYTTMLIMQFDKENNVYVAPRNIAMDVDNDIRAGSLALQLYEEYDTDPLNPLEPPVGGQQPGPNWVSFSTAVTTYVNKLDPGGQGLGIFINLRAIAAGIVPSPYSSMHSYFADLLKGVITTQQSFTSVWGDYQTELAEAPGLHYISNQIALFKQAASVGDHTDLMRCFGNIRNYLQIHPNGLPLRNDAQFCNVLNKAINFSLYSANWSVNTPSGVVSIGSGTAGNPPKNPAPVQFTFDHMEDFFSVMTTQSSSYPSCIPDPSKSVTWSMHGNTGVNNWGDLFNMINAGSNEAFPVTVSYAGVKWTFTQNGGANTPVTVSVEYGDPLFMPREILAGLIMASVNVDQNPAFRDLVDNYLPPP